MTLSSRVQQWTSARVVGPHGVVFPGWLQAVDGTIVDIGTGAPPALPLDGAAEVHDLGGAWLLPGFVDLHMHGGGGHDAGSSAAGLAAAVEFHAGHGTTSTLVSLMTAPIGELTRQLGIVAEAVGTASVRFGRVLGAHLEGPFLAPRRCGAQDPEQMLTPDREMFSRLFEAAGGHLRSITLAPELPGATDLVGHTVASGVVAALGHSDATYAEARAAIDAGAALATHLFNGMRPLHHREPGLVGAALESGIVCEVINDGIHVHPAAAAVVTCLPSRLALVTDAMSATGVGDGDYTLGGRSVRVEDGRARLTSTGSLAGSTLTMDEALRRAVMVNGMTVEAASAAASTTPARVLGIADRIGTLAPGAAADLVVLNDQLQVIDVFVAGRRAETAHSDDRVTAPAPTTGSPTVAEWRKFVTDDRGVEPLP